MAMPPDPIDEVLPQADAAYVAEVTQILHQDEQEKVPELSDPGDVDIPRDLPAQTVELRIAERLFGDLAGVGDTITVSKPAGEYVLRAGVQGPFLLARQDDNTPVIIGLYGPDTYSLRVLKAAIQKHGR